jgi:ACS family D-galactonate transporter-like MFS transporter
MTAPTTHEAPTSARMNGVLFLLSLSVLINYIDRSNLSIAAPLIKDELHISASQLGTLLSAFFWTYAFMQIPAGLLVDRFDVKWIFTAGFFLWSAATAVTGVLHGFAALLTIRVVLGVGESIAFPSYSKIIGTYFDKSRRGSANSLIIAGLALGPALGMLVGGNAVGRFGWRPFFLALGLLGLLWLAPWWALMPRRKTLYVTPAPGGPGFIHVCVLRSAWGTCLGQAAINYYLYFLVTWLPFYLVRSRHLSMNSMARHGGLVFLMSALTATVWGKLSDHWVKTGSSPTFVCKSSMALGCGGIGVTLALTPVTEGYLFIVMLAMTGMFLGISGCHSWAIPQALAGPLMVGRWTGLQNFIGNLGGAVAPLLTGLLVDRTGSFHIPFFITAVVAGVGALSWTLIVGPIEPVNWEAVARPLPILASTQPAP